MTLLGTTKHRTPTVVGMFFTLSSIVLAVPPNATASPYAVQAPKSAPKSEIPPPPVEDYESLVTEAEAARTRDDFARSADLYGRAYRARPKSERADPLGEVFVKNASYDYNRIYEDGEDHLELREAHEALLVDFLAARARLVETGEATSVPSDLLRDKEDLREAIDAMRARSMPPHVDNDIQSPPPTPHPSSPKQPSTPKRDKIPFILIGTGTPLALTGVGLVALGAINLRFLETRDARFFDKLNAMNYSPEEATTYTNTILIPWREKWTRVATSQLATGCVLTAVGVGLLAWGLARLRKGRQQQPVRAPKLDTTHFRD